jgi:hypothetical protein
LILCLSIKDVQLFGTTHYWNYLENIDQCLPGAEAKEIIRTVKELYKGNIARGRVFIRLALNQGKNFQLHINFGRKK